MLGKMFALGVAGYALSRSRSRRTHQGFVAPHGPPPGFAPAQSGFNAAPAQQFHPMLAPQPPAFAQAGLNPYGAPPPLWSGGAQPAAHSFSQALEPLASLAMAAGQFVLGGWRDHSQPQPPVNPEPHPAWANTGGPQSIHDTMNGGGPRVQLQTSPASAQEAAIANNTARPPSALRVEVDAALKLSEAEVRALPPEQHRIAIQLQAPHVRDALAEALDMMPFAPQHAQRLLQALAAHRPEPESQQLLAHLHAEAGQMLPTGEIAPAGRTAPAQLPPMPTDVAEKTEGIYANLFEEAAARSGAGKLDGRAAYQSIEAGNSVHPAEPQKLAMAGLELLRLANQPGELPKKEIDAWLGFQNSVDSTTLKSIAQGLGETLVSAAQTSSARRMHDHLEQLSARMQDAQRTSPS
jgi:hypothetical protein